MDGLLKPPWTPDPLRGLRLRTIALKKAKAGVGNSFGFTGHISDTLGTNGPVNVL